MRGWGPPDPQELRYRARLKLERAIAIRREALSLSMNIHREAFLADAVRLQAEAAALEHRATDLERGSG
jgi:hypothetical protein